MVMDCEGSTAMSASKMAHKNGLQLSEFLFGVSVTKATVNKETLI